MCVCVCVCVCSVDAVSASQLTSPSVNHLTDSGPAHATASRTHNALNTCLPQRHPHQPHHSQQQPDGVNSCGSVSRASLKRRRSTQHDRDVPPLKRVTHSAPVTPAAAGMIRTATHSAPAAAGTIHTIGATLPAFPPTTILNCRPSLGSSLSLSNSPSLGNSRLLGRVPSTPWMLTSCALTVNSTATTTAGSGSSGATLFSIPVQLEPGTQQPASIVRSVHLSINNSPLLITQPLIYLLSPTVPASISQKPLVQTSPSLQHLLPPNVPLVSCLLRPAGTGQSASSAASVMNIHRQPVGGATVPHQSHVASSLPPLFATDIQLVSSPLQRVHQSLAAVATSLGIPHIPRTFMPLSLPLNPLRPVGRANVLNQSRAPAASIAGIPLVVRNSVPLRFPLSNIPLLSHVLRPLVGASGGVDQSAARLVSCVGGQLNGLVTTHTAAAAANHNPLASPTNCPMISPADICLAPPRSSHIPTMLYTTASSSQHAPAATAAGSLSTHSLLRAILSNRRAAKSSSSSQVLAETAEIGMMSSSSSSVVDRSSVSTVSADRSIYSQTTGCSVTVSHS